MEIGKAQRPAVGQKVCGDHFTFVHEQDVVIALADGLGHGPSAHEASVAFCDYVVENAGRDLEDLMVDVSRSIARTRGAAAAIIRISADERHLTFVGVGNVDLQAVSREPIRPVCVPGIVGHRLRKTLRFDYALHRGDLLVLYSDGISSRFRLEEFRELGAQEIADRLLEKHGKNHDDASVIVLRF